MGHPTVEMRFDERKSLEDAWKFLNASDTVSQWTVDTYGDLDPKAGEAMRKMGGMGEV